MYKASENSQAAHAPLFHLCSKPAASRSPHTNLHTGLWQSLYMKAMKCNCGSDTFDKLTDNLCTVSALTKWSLILQGPS